VIFIILYIIYMSELESHIRHCLSTNKLLILLYIITNRRGRNKNRYPIGDKPYFANPPMRRILQSGNDT